MKSFNEGVDLNEVKVEVSIHKQPSYDEQKAPDCNLSKSTEARNMDSNNIVASSAPNKGILKPEKLSRKKKGTNCGCACAIF